MRRDLHDVVTCIGTWSKKGGYYGFVQRRRVVTLRLPGVDHARKAGQRMLQGRGKAAQRSRNRAGCRSSKPHNPDAATAWRCGDGCNRVELEKRFGFHG